MASSTAEASLSKDTSPKADVVPVIDFSLFRSEKQLQVAKELFAAFKDSGFVYLRNHAVPQDIVDEAFRWVRLFFAANSLFLNTAEYAIECKVLRFTAGDQRQGTTSARGMVAQGVLRSRQRESLPDAIRQGNHRRTQENSRSKGVI
jgi:isopenicillin N synthase-like dioxygenase